jgi:apolipoprotein D and lipocalin family protein
VILPLLLLALGDLQTVKKVDLQKYSGRWYEIARLPNKFQKDCSGNVTAYYKLNADQTIEVLNRCREEGKSKPKEATGVGRVAKGDDGSNSVLEVRFAPAILSFIGAVWGDYRIIGLDSKYSYAMVGSNDRKYLWILSRQPALGVNTYNRLLKDAAKQGFDSSRVVRTPQAK